MNTCDHGMPPSSTFHLLHCLRMAGKLTGREDPSQPATAPLLQPFSHDPSVKPIPAKPGYAQSTPQSLPLAPLFPLPANGSLQHHLLSLPPSPQSLPGASPLCAPARSCLFFFVSPEDLSSASLCTDHRRPQLIVVHRIGFKTLFMHQMLGRALLTPSLTCRVPQTLPSQSPQLLPEP